MVPITQSSHNNDDINFVTKKALLHKELNDPAPVARTLKVHSPHKITKNATSNSLLHSPEQRTQKGARKKRVIDRNPGYSYRYGYGIPVPWTSRDENMVDLLTSL